MIRSVSRLLAVALSLCLVVPALAQVQPGQSPLSGSKGGTGNAFMRFTGPATSIKTYTLPNASGTIDLLNAIQTITAAKTFNSGTLLLAGSSSGTTTVNASVAASGTLTLPAATDTLVGKATTDTLTNKTFDTAGAGNSFSINGLAVTANTGTGAVARASSPSFTTPTLGVASATSINKVAITAPASGATLTIADGKTLTASNTLTFTGTDSSSVAFGGGGIVAYWGNNLSAFAATTSSQLAGVISDETGSGALVFGTSPSLTTPALGIASATSINKVAITAPATSATLTIPDGVTLTGPAASGTTMTLGNAETVTGSKSFNSGTLIQKGSSSGTTTVQASAVASGTLTLPAATDTLVGKATTDTLSNKTIDTASSNTLKVNGNSLSASAGTATLTLPNATDTLVGRATTDTLTNKTLTSPVIGTIVNTGTLTLPTSTDTLVGRATTDTLTNKTIDTASTTFKLNGVAFGTATQATAALNAVVGDSGSGGTKGLVPAPGAGDASAGKFLKADGTWAVPAGGGGGGGMTDTERQNAKLDRIYASKLLGDIRRQVNEMATGFKASTDALRGINTASSSNVDTTNAASSGYVAPTSTGTVNGNFAQANNTSISLGSGVSTYHGFRWTATATGTISTVVINIASVTTGGNVLARLYTNNSGSPGTQIGTASGTVNVTTTGDKTFTFGTPPAVTSGTDYWIIIDNSAAGFSGAITTATAIAGYSSGRASSITSIVGDNYSSSLTIRVQINYATLVSNMTLVTAAQTLDASASNARVLMEINPVDAITLNTDLTAEVSCNGGTNYASATLSSVGTGQSGRTVVETADTACTSGTSAQARIKTLSNKNVQIHGLSLTVH